MKKTDMNTNCPADITRRTFINAAASSAAFTIVPRHVLGGAGYRPPSETLEIACIGMGNKGFDNVRNAMDENLVAFCDVDTKLAGKAFEMFPDVPRYTDYRRMLDREENNIDAVIVTTPDHVHIPASVTSMRMGKHVYCEKPLGQNIHEVRFATKVAKETGPLTETVLLGTVAFRAGDKLEWAAENLKITNNPGAERFLQHDAYRAGWTL